MTPELATNILIYGTGAMALIIIVGIIAFVVVYERKRNKKFYGYNATDNTWYERELEPEKLQSLIADLKALK
jgi:hypothetical protein